MSVFQPSLASCPATTGHLSPLSRDIADYPDGIVLPIDKPWRWTSADVIRKVKYAAIRHFRKKNLKVGHAGTLDPLATGVLLVCIGPACKRAQEFQDHDKEYEAVVRFGATTPSYDLEKEVDRTFPYAHVTEEAVRAVLPSFLGTQEQIAPLFSAKSVDGVRAYEMARKLYKASRTASVIPAAPTVIPSAPSVIPAASSVIPGLTGNLPDFDAAALETLQKSTITVSGIELLDFSTPPAAPLKMTEDSAVSGTASSRIHFEDTSALGLPEARIRIACSKGTYIRAFARDLGEALGTGAHLASLVRTKTGAFRLEDALSLDQALALLAEA